MGDAWNFPLVIAGITTNVFNCFPIEFFYKFDIDMDSETHAKS